MHEAEALKRTEEVWNQIRKWTGPVIAGQRQPDHAVALRHLGSCVYMRDDAGRHRAVTCAHVLKDCDTAICSMDPVDTSTWMTKVPEATPAPILARDVVVDLALLDAPPAPTTDPDRQYWPLSPSQSITLPSLQKHLGCSAFLWGSFGAGATFEKAAGGVRLYSQPPYHAKGKLTSASADLLIGHFPENILHARNTKDFPQLKHLEVRGASRDLSGTSGSGLWLLGANGPILVGILKRPLDGVCADPHIEFIPIWKVLKFLQDNDPLPTDLGNVHPVAT